MNLGDVYLRLVAEDGGFEKDVVKKAGTAGDKAGQTFGQRMKAAFSPGAIGFTAAATGVGAFAAGIGQAVKDLINIERLGAQTDAVLRSTGGAANVTREQVDGLGQSLEKLSGIEAESVTEGQNLLLTFTNIRNEAGAGNDVFNQATEAMLDYSVAMGIDAKSAAIQLGKALNDPVKGLTALGRAGVDFTEDQRTQIKALVETGDLLSAQKIILAELEKQFGGSAEAFGNTTAGKMAKFQNAVGDVFEGIVTGAVDMVEDTSGLFNNFAMDGGEMGDRLHVVAERLGEDFNTVKERVRNEMAETGRSFDDVMTGMEADSYEKSAGITENMSEGVRFAADGMRGAAPVVAKEAGKIAGMLPGEIQAKVNAIRAAGREQVIQFALGVLEAQNDPKTAFEVLTRLQDEELTRAEQISYLHGLAASAELAAGQEDGRPGVSLAADQLVKEIDERLAALGADGYDWGFNIGRELARGLDLSKPIVRTSAGGLAEAVRGQIGIRSEPTDHSSPLYGHMEWGGNLVKDFADGMLANLAHGKNAAAALASTLSPGFGSGTSLAAAGGSPVGFSGSAMPGAINVHVHSTVPPTSVAQQREIAQAVGPALDDYFTGNGRFPRRPRN